MLSSLRPSRQGARAASARGLDQAAALRRLAASAAFALARLEVRYTDGGSST